MTEKNQVWLDLIRKIPGSITAFIAFISTLVGFVKLYQGDKDLVTVILLVVGLGSGILGCAYIAFKRTPPKIQGGRGTWQYPRWRPLAVASLLMVLVLTGVGVSYYFIQQQLPPNKIVILVADFPGPALQKRSTVTDSVLNNLRRSLNRYNDVQIEALKEPITEREGGSDTARDEGEKRKATVVVWGWYDVSDENALLSVYFEVLRPPLFLPELGQEVKGIPRTLAVSQLTHFALQTKLSEEMTYLSLVVVGLVRYQASDWAGAVTRFSDALDSTDMEVPALNKCKVHLLRAKAYFYERDYADAIADYTKALELNPEDLSPYSDRALAYRSQGAYDGAIADYTTLIAVDPENATTYYEERGFAHYLKSELSQAIADYTKAIEHDPNNYDAFRYLGTAHRDQGNLTQAIEDYTKAIQLDPQSVWAYYDRAKAYEEKGLLDKAIEDYTTLIDREPTVVSMPYFLRGSVRREKGDLDQAIDDFTKAIERDPNDGTTYYIRAEVYYDREKYDKAIADYTKALNLNPVPRAAYRCYLERGNAYSANGMLNQAITDYSKAIDLDPNSADAYFRRGIGYRANGLDPQAISDFEMYLRYAINVSERAQVENWLRELKHQ